MALLDFLKKKEEIEKSKKPVEKTEKVSAVKKTSKTTKKAEKIQSAPSKVVAGKNGFSFNVIKQPHISEKGTYLAEKNQYIFDVSPTFSKQEIKKSVEGIYGVNVLSVNTIKIPAKKRRLGKTEGFRKKYKKAIVTIKEGEKIEIL